MIAVLEKDPMKSYLSPHSLFLSLVLALFSCGAEAQSFQNLNFEGAWNNGTIPGWTAASTPYPNPETSYVDFNTGDIDVSVVSIVNSAWAYPGTVIQGNQSLLMATTRFGIGSISQTGTIPVGTQSLTLLARDPWGESEQINGQNVFPVYNPSPLTVSFNGNDLVLDAVSSTTYGNGGPVIEYTANVSQFAGMTGSLMIQADAFPASDNLNLAPGEGWAEIDNIQFSDLPAPAIPEAKAFPLCAACICLLMTFFRLVPRRTRIAITALKATGYGSVRCRLSENAGRAFSSINSTGAPHALLAAVG